jgi:protein SCO1
MSGSQKTITVALWGVVVVGLVVLLAMERTARTADANASATGLNVTAAGGTEAILRPSPAAIELDETGRPVDAGQRQLPEQFVAPSFELIDHRDTPFKSDQLAGKVWTAMLFFSECTGVCPMMTSRITDLQNVLTDPRIEFVSFTVDPANDTPQRLGEYARAANAQPRWHLLTGTVEQMKTTAMGFKVPFNEPADHSSKILLIDARGSVRGIYESREVSEMKLLADDARRLLTELEQ